MQYSMPLVHLTPKDMYITLQVEALGQAKVPAQVCDLRATLEHFASHRPASPPCHVQGYEENLKPVCVRRPRQRGEERTDQCFLGKATLLSRSDLLPHSAETHCFAIAIINGRMFIEIHATHCASACTCLVKGLVAFSAWEMAIYLHALVF